MKNIRQTPPAHTSAPWNPAVLSRGRDGYGVYSDGVSPSSRIAVICPYGTDEEQKANARMMAAAPDLRRESQRLYDALQRYLDVPDSELPDDLVEAMDALEAA